MYLFSRTRPVVAAHLRGHGAIAFSDFMAARVRGHYNPTKQIRFDLSFGSQNSGRPPLQVRNVK